MPRTEDAADAGKIFFESTAAGGIVRPLVEVVLVRLRALLQLYREFGGKKLKYNLCDRNILTISSDFLNVAASLYAIFPMATFCPRELRRQRKYLTYASSVLFVYDGAAVKRFLSDNGGAAALEDAVNVKLIDFAHVFPNEGKGRHDRVEP